MINAAQTLELKLNLPPALAPPPLESPSSSETSSSSAEPSSSSSSSEMSIDGSCVSSEADDQNDTAMSSCSPENDGISDRGPHGGVGVGASSSPMVLVGCPRCLMYVMLSEANPKCPKCKSTVLLDFLNQGTTANKKTGAT